MSIALIFAGCKKSTTISGAGNSFTYPFYDVILENFYDNTGIKILYNQASVNMSIRALHNQTIDFMPVFYHPFSIDQPFNNQFVFIPCLAGAIILAYNLPQTDSLNLNAEAIAGIYSGEIKYWNHPLIQRINPGIALEEIPITPLYRTDDSGSSVILLDYLKANGFELSLDNDLEEEKIFRSVQGVGTKGDESIASNILDTEGAIGFLGLEQATLQNLNTVFVCNAAGNYLRADEHSINEAIRNHRSDEMMISNSQAPEAYPLSTFCGILINKNPNKVNLAKQESLVAFLRYLLEPDIQQRATLMNYVSLPDSILLKANRLIDSVEYTDENE